jgi:hypothetical protein
VKLDRRIEPITASIEIVSQALGVSRSAGYRMANNGELDGAYRSGGRWLVDLAALRAGSARRAAEAHAAAMPASRRVGVVLCFTC